jgi:hypothetical protein
VYFYVSIFAYLAFDAAAIAGMASGGTSGEQALFVVLFSTCVHCLLK